MESALLVAECARARERLTAPAAIKFNKVPIYYFRNLAGENERTVSSLGAVRRERFGSRGK